MGAEGRLRSHRATTGEATALGAGRACGDQERRLRAGRSGGRSYLATKPVKAADKGAPFPEMIYRVDESHSTDSKGRAAPPNTGPRRPNGWGLAFSAVRQPLCPRLVNSCPASDANRDHHRAAQSSGVYPQQMLRRSISVMLAGLLIVAAVAVFVMEPRKAIGVAAAFCLVVGVLWLYDALRGLRGGQ